MLTTEEELRLVRMQLDTMRNDRDAEKDMKAKARMQRDKMTKRSAEAIALLKSITGLSDHPKWLEVQAFLENHN